MSKLRRQIRNLGRPPAGSIGFQYSRSSEQTRQALVAAEVSSGAEAKAAVEAGAHVLVAAADAVADAVAAAGELPVGVRLEAASAAAIAAASDAGADFVVFDDGRTPAAALLTAPDAAGEPIGRVLILGNERGDERLRALAGLGADAILVDDIGADLTVRDQLALRRISELAGAPVVVDAASASDTDVLRTWRDAGAPMVLVRGNGDAVRTAVAAAAGVPAPRRPRDDRSALVPSLAPHSHDDGDDDL